MTQLLRLKPSLIGLTGRAGAGKDTAAYHLTAEHGYHARAFAEPLRRGVAAMLGLESSHFQHPIKEVALPEIGKSPRQLLQTLGTEWGRNLVHPDLWLILARQEITGLWEAGKPVVITDVRFENEAAMIRELGGVIWHIDRHGAGTAHQHISEIGVRREWNDLGLANEGSITDLYAAIDGVLA